MIDQRFVFTILLILFSIMMKKKIHLYKSIKNINKTTLDENIKQYTNLLDTKYKYEKNIITRYEVLNMYNIRDNILAEIYNYDFDKTKNDNKIDYSEIISLFITNIILFFAIIYFVFPLMKTIRNFGSEQTQETAVPVPHKKTIMYLFGFTVVYWIGLVTYDVFLL